MDGRLSVCRSTDAVSLKYFSESFREAPEPFVYLFTIYGASLFVAGKAELGCFFLVQLSLYPIRQLRRL